MTKRIDRINQLIKKELGGIILKDIEFPENVLVTLTEAKTTVDLREVNILISILPEKKSETVFNILNENIYILQQKLNQRLKMRPLPRIKFLKEKRTIQAGRIEEILAKLDK